MNKEAAFLFDMDGVIVDSNPVHRTAWLRYNASQGVQTSEAMQERMYGKRNDEIIRDFLGEHLTDEEVFAHGAAKEEVYRALIEPLLPGALVAGLPAFLTRWAGIPMACGSNAEPANIRLVLEAAGIAHYFRATVDGFQVKRPKPFPDIYLRAAERLGVEPVNCLVFEDSFPGVAAGQAAGMQVVGLRTTHAELPGVDLAVDDFRAPELEDFVARFLKERGVAS